jgi:hypothetical protein
LLKKNDEIFVLRDFWLRDFVTGWFWLRRESAAARYWLSRFWRRRESVAARYWLTRFWIRREIVTARFCDGAILCRVIVFCAILYAWFCRRVILCFHVAAFAEQIMKDAKSSMIMSWTLI